jgi:AcrR family transcriptional regulator
MSKRPAKAPGAQRAGLTPERIADAALEILDRASDETALTARSLARALGVSAPSLYAHVTGMEEVLDLVHRRINESIDMSPLVQSTSEDDFREVCHRYRNAYRAHRVASTIIASRSINRDHALRVYEPLAAYLVARGVPHHRVMPAMATLDNLIMGSSVQPFAEGFIGAGRDYLPDHPALAQSLDRTNRTTIDDVGFSVGLDAFCRIVTEMASPASGGNPSSTPR